MKALRRISDFFQKKYAQYPDLFCLLFMLLIVMIAYWPVTTMYGSLKWDKIDTSLPWLSLISDISREGDFPWWNPYQQIGYPLYGDMQNPIWNPLYMLFLRLVNFNIGWFHFLEIVMMWGASAGMYYLLRFFGVSRRGAVVFGLSYALSGFMVGRGQNLISNLGGLWMPFALHHILAFFKKSGLKTAFFMAFFLSLQVTGGYQAMTIILIYLVLILSLYTIVDWYRNRRYPIIDWLKFGVLGVAITLVFCLFTIYVVYDTYLSLARVEGLPEYWIVAGHFPINSIENFLIPSYTMGSSEFFTSDASFRNLFFGFFSVLFAIIGLLHFKKLDRQVQILMIFGAVCFIAAMGAETPFRLWLAHNLPGMASFRFPYFFAWFFLVPLIIIGAKYFDYITVKKQLQFRFSIGVIVLGVGLVVITLNHYFKVGWPDFSTLEYTWKSWTDFLRALNRNQLGLLHGLVQVFLFAVAVVSIYLFNWSKAKVIGTIIVIDLIIAIQFVMPFTYVDRDAETKILLEKQKKMPDDFPVPALVPLGKLDSLGVKETRVWQNVGNFYRYPDEGGYSSFWLKNMGDVEVDYPYIYDSIKTNPVVYWADSVTQNDEFKGLSIANKHHVSANTEQSYRRVAPGDITIEKFGPAGFRFKVKTEKKNLLVVQQANFHRWRAFVDYNSERIVNVNGFMMGVEIPAGEHVVEFNFYDGIITPMYYFNILVWIIGFGIIIGFEYQRQTTNKKKKYE